MLFWLLLGGAAFGEEIQVNLAGGRKLMINGDDITDISTAPFAVAIVQCSVSDGSYYCGKFCSGALIAPDVVLTAGHCTHDADSPFGTSSPPRSVSGLYILAGTTNLFDGKGTLVKVASVHNGGYSLNLRYTMDNDHGLIFLSTCVTLQPGVIETIPAATLASEPNWETGSCAERSTTTFGFGIKTNLPSPIGKDDGIMRSVDSVVHSTQVCKQAYVDSAMADLGYTSALLDQPGYAAYKSLYYSTVSSEYHLCSGGQDNTSSCFGDSGGPMVAYLGTASQQIVGVTSFGVAQFCGLGPDFLQRVASHSQWIYDTMEAHGKKCVPIANAFASSISSLAARDTTRCLTSEAPWQCFWGKCLPVSDVCDNSSDCGSGDTSDEGSSYCSDSRRLMETSNNDTLEKLIEAYKATHPERPSSKSNSATPDVVIVGSLSDAGRVNNPIGGKGGLKPSPKVSTSTANRSSANCSNVNSILSSMMSAASAAGDNAAESDPSEFSSACQVEQNCASSNSFTVNSSVHTFCESFMQFVEQRSIAASLASGFSSKYNEACLPATKASSSTSTTTTTSTTSSTTTTRTDNSASADTTISPTSSGTTSIPNSTSVPTGKGYTADSLIVYLLIGLIVN